MSEFTDRYTMIVPVTQVAGARAILGQGSFTCEGTQGKDNSLTHYISSAHPTQVTQEQLDAIDALPDGRVYGPHLTRAQALSYVGITFRQTLADKG